MDLIGCFVLTEKLSSFSSWLGFLSCMYVQLTICVVVVHHVYLHQVCIVIVLLLITAVKFLFF
jgi:hypothetical protein